MPFRPSCALAIAACLVLVGQGRTWAHCATPEVSKIALDPSTPGGIELMMTFGNARSDDGGGSWHLQCDEVYLPPGVVVGARNLLMSPVGRMVIAHYSGLFTSDDRGCGYGRATGVPKDMYDNDPPVFDAALDEVDPASKLYAVVADTVWHSDDGGKSLTMLEQFEGHQLTRVLTSAGDPKFVFLTSFVPNPKGGAEFFVAWSENGGAGPWTLGTLPSSTDIVRAAFVDPFAPHRLYAVIGRTDQALYALDASAKGLAASKVFSVANPDIAPEDRELWAAPGNASGELWVGVRGDDLVADAAELHHSTDGGGKWEKVAGMHPHFRCLQNLDGDLWACGNNLAAAGDTFAAGSSDDGGKTWKSRFAMGDLCEALPCLGTACMKVFEAACTPGLCLPKPPDAAAGDGGVTDGGAEDAPAGEAGAGDTGADVPADGGKDLPQDDGGMPEPPASGGGCGCDVGAGPTWLAALVLLAGLGASPRRRASTR